MVVCGVSVRRRAAEASVPEIWAGVDIGKEHHHCVVINGEGDGCCPAGSSTTRLSCWNCSTMCWRYPMMPCGQSTSTMVVPPC